MGKGNRLGKGVYHNAIVTGKNDNGTYNLLFYDGLAEANVEFERIKPMWWGMKTSSRLPEQREGDSVFARMLPNTTSHIIDWLEKRQESMESVFASVLTEHSISSAEADTDTKTAPAGAATFTRVSERM